jgi:hypothetical protein
MAVPVNRLEGLAQARLTDASALKAQGRHDAGYYLCGYAVELALKARICKTLGWAGYPESKKELQIFRELHSHDLDMLLQFTGREAHIRGNFSAEWSTIVQRWKPSMRYDELTITEANLDDAIAAATTLVNELL